MEVWKNIPWGDNYQVSDHGRVRSLERIVVTKNGYQRKYRGYILNPTISKSHGYCIVCVSGTHSLVHRLVAEVFIPNPDNKQCVNHKDFDRHNNRVNNLEWVTRAENVEHQHRNGRITHGEDHSYSQINDFQARVIKKTTGLYQRELGEIFGVSRNVIRFIQTGRSWKHI